MSRIKSPTRPKSPDVAPKSTVTNKQILELAALHMSGDPDDRGRYGPLRRAVEAEQFSRVAFEVVANVLHGNEMLFRSTYTEDLKRMKQIAEAIGANVEPCDDFMKPGSMPVRGVIRITPKKL